jgi:hypothetical protein
MRPLSRRRIFAGILSALAFGVLGCLDHRTAPPLPVEPVVAYAPPAQAAAPAAETAPSLALASGITRRGGWVRELPGLAQAGWSAEETERASALLTQLRERCTRNIPADDALGQGFLAALADAYNVETAAELQGRVTAVLITDTRLDSDLRYYYFGETPKAFPSASTVKTAIIARFFAELEDRGQAPDDRTIDGVDYDPYLRNMVAHSDNYSANKVMQLHGKDDLASWLERLGIARSDLRIRSNFVSKGPVQGGGNSCTAEGLAELYFLLAQDKDVPDFLTAASIDAVHTLIDSGGDNNNVPAYNDRLNALFPQRVRFLHKTGSNSRVLGDAGIVVDGERRFILVILDRTVTRKSIQRFGLSVLNLMRDEQGSGWGDSGSDGGNYSVPSYRTGPQIFNASR